MKLRRILVFLVGFIGLFTLLSCSNGDDPVEPVSNEYELDGELVEISTKMYWFGDSNQGSIDQLRLLEPFPDGDLNDLIILSPVPGSSFIEGTYVYSKTGDVGTYNMEFVHATDGQSTFEWISNGDDGSLLEIILIGTENGENIYQIILPQFNLNYGYWDYLGNEWVSYGNKSFRFSYEGGVNARQN